MENKLKEKYGLGVAICMVIGIVIGCGLFLIAYFLVCVCVFF